MPRTNIPNPTDDAQWKRGVTETLRKLARRHMQVAVVGGGGGSGLGESDVTNLIDTNSYVTIQDEGTPLTQRNVINFIGATVTAADDAGNTRTNVTVTSSGSGYDTIQEEGAGLTQRSTFNFIGSAVTASDNAASTRTDVRVTSMPGPELKGEGGIFGSIINAKLGATPFPPFISSTAATPAPTNQDYICPATGWVYNPAVRHGDETSANGVTYRLGLQVNGTNYWGGVIQPQAAAGASTIDDVVVTRILRGDNLKVQFNSTGASENTSFGPWSAEFLGDGSEIILGGPIVGAAGASIFNPIFGHAANPTEANARTPMIAGTMKWLYLKLNVGLSGDAGESATFTIYKNGSPTSLAVTVPVDGLAPFDGGLDNTVWADLTNTVVFAEGDTISAETTTSHASVGSLDALCSFAFVPDDATEIALFGTYQDNLQVGATIKYLTPFVRGNGTWANTEANTMLVMPRAGTVPADGLQAYFYTATTGSNVHIFTVRKNGVDSGVVLTFNAASGTGVVTSSGTPVDFEQGDVLSISADGSGYVSGVQGALGAWCLKITT